MEINDLGSADRLHRKRQHDAARAAATRPSDTGAGAADEAQVSGLDQAAVTRLVDRLKGMDPVQAHRVEALRKQITEGSYSADPDALAEAFITRDDGR
jgi:flagellar biosynthesis anti-sigma factor FlgM